MSCYDRNLPDAPWIRNCERWGYPARPEFHMCERCGAHIAYDEGEYDGDKWLCYECLAELENEEEEDDE